MLDPWGADVRSIHTAGERVLGCYDEPIRRYHTTEHLSECLAMVGDLVDLALQPVAVELAAWFHDVVYDPGAPPGVNESASTAVAADVLLSLGIPPETVATVNRLIGTTVTHSVTPNDVDAAVLVDADLWILGSPRARYRRYAADVRTEFGWLDDEAWRRGRSRVLSGFLGRTRIFTTDRAHRALDSGARANMAGELAALRRREPEA